VSATNSVATDLAQGWTRYDSINQVFDLTFAPDGTLWAATEGGLAHWDPDSDTYTRYDLRPGRIALAPDSTLWLVMDGELWHFDGTTARFMMAPGVLDGPIRSIVAGVDGTLWLATGRDVRRFDGNDWHDYPSVAGASMLVPGPDGEVWSATHDGLARYLPAEDGWVSYTEEDGLPGRNTHKISVSRAGKVWAYWPWKGLYALEGGPEDPDWTRLEDPCRTQLSDLAFASDGTVWATSAGSGHYPGACVAYYDGEGWVEVAGGQGLSTTAEMAPGPSGQVAVVTSQGIGPATS
jgi:ligand-binding sensor domain-containing protein